MIFMGERRIFLASVYTTSTTQAEKGIGLRPASSFRFSAIGVIADVKQAFLQIRLRTEDRDFLRFLWWENAECSKIRIYGHCRVVFGVSSSPFLLNAVISYHLEREKFQTESLRKTIGHLKERFYVDNLVTSVNDVTELEQL
ncbi:uncharacterized protein TNCV_4561531 [Trichonephila clavipes]|nr:uncharacterized protein TNCV_4561531 [Trichonephila clavipes]